MVFASFTRRLSRAGIAFAIIGAAALTSCAQDQDFLIVEQAVWFAGGEACTLTANDETPLALTVDVSVITRIGMGFVVTNLQSPNPNSNTGIDDSEVVIESAEVNLRFTGGGLPSSSYESSLATNSIAGGSSEVFLIQVPSEVSDSIRASMNAGQFETLEMEVVFKGRKYGQAGDSKLGEVETRAYVFPFEICHGCLADPACTPAPTGADWVGGTCGFAQGAFIQHPEAVCGEDPNTTGDGDGDGP